MQHRAMDILEQARLQNIGMIEAIRRADKLMYWAKQKRNDVQT